MTDSEKLKLAIEAFKRILDLDCFEVENYAQRFGRCLGIAEATLSTIAEEIDS